MLHASVLRLYVSLAAASAAYVVYLLCVEVTRSRAAKAAVVEKIRQQQETIRASGGALTNASTVLLAQDTGALATLLSGAQGSGLAPKLGR